MQTNSSACAAHVGAAQAKVVPSCSCCLMPFWRCGVPPRTRCMCSKTTPTTTDNIYMQTNSSACAAHAGAAQVQGCPKLFMLSYAILEVRRPAALLEHVKYDNPDNDGQHLHADQLAHMYRASWHGPSPRLSQVVHVVLVFMTWRRTRLCASASANHRPITPFRLRSPRSF